MGRELKRVPENFDAPIGRVWKGYINPHQGPVYCSLCDGWGSHNPEKGCEADKCPACKGKGIKFPPHVPRRPYKAWRECEPPTGEGFQLWQTTIYGSPVSPVFANPQDLAHWCADNATVFADEKTSYENWLKMFVEDSLEVGSLFALQPGFAGALVNAPV